MISPLLIFSVVQILRAISQNSSKPYFGVPLGAIHCSDSYTRAEAYAANEYSIIFHHFTHRPHQLGCTSMIIGPTRIADLNTVGGGIFLSISHPTVTFQRNTGRRYIRQVPFTVFGMSNWPVQFDHPEFRKDGKEQILKQQKDPFAGIELDVKSSVEINPKTRDIHIEGISSHDTESSMIPTTRNSDANFSSIATTEYFSSESANEITLFDTNASEVFDGNEDEQSNPYTDSVSTDATAAINTEGFASDKTNSARSEFERGGRAETATSGNGILKMLITTAENSEHVIEPNEGKVDERVQDSKKKLLLHLETEAENSSKIDQKGKRFPVILGQAKHEKWFEKQSQQSTAEKQIKDPQFPGALFMPAQIPKKTVTPLFRESTPLYWVIQDPRLKKRRRLDFRGKTIYENGLNQGAVTTTWPRLREAIDRRFQLPLIEDETVVFSVPNSSKITEFQWVALRNHCSQRTIHLLSLKGIDPPHQEKIGTLLGQSHNVTSYRVKILNCNTVAIPGFVFSQGDDPPGTYFHVGIGRFPEKIEKQVRAYVVGQEPNQPLRNYKGENVMVRLPKTYRTFDIDFISVFNEIEGRSYGHVNTPNLLVPPCNDYDVI